MSKNDKYTRETIVLIFDEKEVENTPKIMRKALNLIERKCDDLYIATEREKNRAIYEFESYNKMVTFVERVQQLVNNDRFDAPFVAESVRINTNIPLTEILNLFTLEEE